MVNLKRKERIAKKVQLFLEKQDEVSVYKRGSINFRLKLFFLLTARKKRSRSFPRISNKIQNSWSPKTSEHHAQSQQSLPKYIQATIVPAHARFATRNAINQKGTNEQNPSRIFPVTKLEASKIPHWIS